MTVSLLTILGAYLAAALVIGVAPTRFRRSTIATAAAVMVGTLVWVLDQAGSVVNGEVHVETLRWIPSLGVAFELRIDALAITFISLISGVGLGIVAFSGAYMRTNPRFNRFLSLLVMFAGAMIGLSATDNIFGLFVFWELTTITSYLLVGFDDEKAGSRSAALQAVLTTGLGGLALLGGLVLLAQAAGTASLAEIVASPPTGIVATIGLALALVGAFTKSAQAPFHFWLPGAMAAPTPASAYLHSATMVKAGILLLLRMAPGFNTASIWTPVVVSVGLATMVIGAWRALRQTDLKLLLAYGTVSQLGFMTALVGLGSPAMLHAALAVLISHALFKSALFLTVGAIDSTAGTRDIRKLSGVGRQHPLLALTGALAAASMAGIAPLLGFVTKEAAFAALIDAQNWAPLAIIAAASAATAAYSLKFWWEAFATKPQSPEHAGGDPAPLRIMRALVAAPLILASAGVVLGLAPGIVDRLVYAFAPGAKLVLWPGWKAALAVSATVVVLGVIMHIKRESIARAQQRLVGGRLSRISADEAYQWTIVALNRVADRITGVVQHGSLPLYLAVILTAVIAAPMVAFGFAGGVLSLPTGPFSLPEAGMALLVVAPALAALRVSSRMVAVLLLGAVGYAMAGIFVLYGAPDLALTLLLVETVVIAIFAFVLSRLPRHFEIMVWRIRSAVRAAVAVGVGGFVAAAALLASGQRNPGPTPSAAYQELAPAAGGKNIVNVILTDFRALDTLGEITVIATAAIGVAALISGFRTPAEEAE